MMGRFIGVSAPRTVTAEMVGTMNKDAVVFACANPTPEILPDDAKAGGARVISTGRSDYPNQINNVLAFPGVFRGAFDTRASDINEEMKMAATRRKPLHKPKRRSFSCAASYKTKYSSPWGCFLSARPAADLHFTHALLLRIRGTLNRRSASHTV